MTPPARKPYKKRLVNARQKIEEFIEGELRKTGGQEVAISRAAIMAALPVATETVQLANRTMAASGRWEVIRGGGTSTTTYRLLED